MRVADKLGALAAVCDPSPDALADAAKMYPRLNRFEDVEDLLRDPLDAILIAAPEESHAQLALQCLAAGKHILVEDPFTLSVADAEAVAAAAVATGLHVFVGHTLIYHSAIRKLRATIASGTLGRIWHLRSRRGCLGNLQQHKSVWWSLASRDVSLMLALMGEDPSNVVGAHSGWLTARRPDIAYADFQFPYGRSAHVEVTWLDPNDIWHLDVFGTQGVVRLVETSESCRMELIRCGARSDERGVLDSWRGGTMEIPYERSEPLHDEVLAFLTSLRFGIAAETDANEGLAVVRTLALADRAAHLPYALEARA